ncbi:MAG: elongation factor G [Candidatus Cloacimonetes bacterium]|nr:elongation factor G [Candidatus Cloacimonadota bacterium]MBL7085600.1 elongation factor G [Candidatus Cloacimonadota bacterium]
MAQAYPLEKIRNIGLIAHIDAGKTTVTERILFYTGRTHQMGEVHDGTATMDWMIQEKERGITITSATTTCYWEGYRINIIDTPGHVDFTVEVERSLRVLDGAVVIFCGVAGVEPQSETVWHQADRYNIPRLVFINKLDRVGADFEFAVETIKSKLQPDSYPIQFPIMDGENFLGIANLINKTAYIYDKDDLGIQYTKCKIENAHRISSKFKEMINQNRNILIEKLAEFDETILQKYLNDREILPEDLISSIRKLTIDCKFVPILCGSALKNKAIQPLVDAIVDFLPSPIDIPAFEAIIPNSNDKKKIIVDESLPFAALAFKNQVNPYVGKLTYLRAYSGKINKGDYVLNMNTGKKERITRILHMHSDKSVNVNTLYAGEICAVVGLNNTSSGDSIVAQDNPVLLEKIKFSDPVMSVAIEPKTKLDQDNLKMSLPRLLDEDPTYLVKENKETGQTLIYGMGELHLEILLDRLRRDFKINVNVGRPRVNYKETITNSIEAVGKLVRNVGVHGQYAVLKLRIEPYSANLGIGKQKNKIYFENISSEDEVPKHFLGAVKAGIFESAESGILTGNKVENIKVVIIGGSFNPVDSSELAFKVAASMAFNNALRKAKSILLEPIMKINIVTPEDYLGNVINDLNSRRGKIIEVNDKNSVKIINGFVPLSGTFGYTTNLRSVSQGRASYSMEFFKYDKVPENISNKIIEKMRGY